MPETHVFALYALIRHESRVNKFDQQREYIRLLLRFMHFLCAMYSLCIGAVCIFNIDINFSMQKRILFQSMGSNWFFLSSFEKKILCVAFFFSLPSLISFMTLIIFCSPHVVSLLMCFEYS